MSSNELGVLFLLPSILSVSFTTYYVSSLLYKLFVYPTLNI